MANVNDRFIGLGVSHYPPLSGRDADMANILRGRMRDPDIPATAKEVSSWPELMQREWSHDEGAAGATLHRQAMLNGLRKVKEALDDFRPDFVLIWGDDQYENFKEDVVPAFAVLAYGDTEVQPWRHASASAIVGSETEDEWGGGKANVWDEGKNTSFVVRGHPEAAKTIAAGLLEAEFDIAYAYKPLHHPGLAHAFLNAVMYTDYDRQGFDHPVVPISVNCYGRQIISHRGFISRWADRNRPLDPPSPSPKRCFDLGAAIGRILKENSWRVALMASSSWSHAFLVDKTYRLRPDVESDRALYDSMVSGNYEYWHRYTLAQLEESAQQEVLNWFALMGAMNELGMRVEWSEFVETYVYNSSKVAAIFR